jgi:hypothetical protein
MGFKTSLIGIGPNIPRLDLLKHEEGGPIAAAATLATFLPSIAVGPPVLTTLDEAAYPGAHAFGVATFGPTTVLAGMLAVEHSAEIHARAAASHLRTWCLQIHSVVDLCAFEARDPSGAVTRRVELHADMADLSEAAEGEPLPFEGPYWAGEHREDVEEGDEWPYPFDFHPLALGDAAIAWLFGTSGEGAAVDEVQASLPPLRDIWEIPAHVFTPERPRQRGFFSRRS